MCGICGSYHFDGSEPDLNALSKMLKKLERRGPDHEGSFSDGPVALGHRRLSIIDLTERSNQPMVDSDAGLVLVFNGAIYNYPQLRSQLKTRGYHFFSEGDSEVIIKAYKEWGEACVEHLQGMFAFAVWDMREKSLFLARDRFGIKPLYWNSNDNQFRFASNLQALLAAGDVDKSIDPAGLHFLFTLHAVIPAPGTILAGVHKLEPAHWMQVDARGGVTKGRYWQLDATRPGSP